MKFMREITLNLQIVCLV